MYGDTERVKIGNFTICRQNPDGEDDSLWIEKEDGEGMEIKESLVETHIKNIFSIYM